MTAPRIKNEPWKHPAVHGIHVVSMTLDGTREDPISVATCWCGWSNRVATGHAGAGYVAQDDAVEAHWNEAIATAGAKA